MRKSVKYMGVVSAILLTAPLIAPIIPNTTVQAQSSDDPNYQNIIDNINVSKLNSIANEVKTNLKSYNIRNDYYPNLQDIFSGSLDISEMLGVDKGSFTLDYQGFSDLFDRKKLVSDSSSKYLQDNLIFFAIKIYDSDNNQITDEAGIKKLQDNKSPFKLSIDLIYLTKFEENGDNDPILETGEPIEASQNVPVNVSEEKASSANFKYKDKITVKEGTPLSELNNVESIDPHMIDTSANSPFNGYDINATYEFNKIVGLYYYLSKKTARYSSGNFSDYSKTNPDYDSEFMGSPEATPEGVDMGDTITTKYGTKYYRMIQLDIKNFTTEQAGQIVGDNISYLFGNKDKPDTELFVNGVNVKTLDYNLEISLSGREMDLMQEIDVVPNKDSSNQNNNDVEEITGIVTTHTDQKSYALYNDDNVKIDNRALMANSSWQVDGVRTVKGIKQYRVSTHEWVNASDVDFVSNGEVTEGMTVTKLDDPMQINLASHHDRYGLQNSKRENSKTRALAGGTSWLVDKIGTDMHGGIYYGVSTDEFVKAGDGVNIVK
ncbi:hypothetical protein [Companilactobacillus keshanensis]|uniref:Surface layer protein A domain-containing protein n=1 Tax=Companilactobacillus keshanensis TaxID=2486003 RepID=A0ABW4BT12_9LACO|nr:hypothetical protein [Companilactobacillus keshanensis]